MGWAGARKVVVPVDITEQSLEAVDYALGMGIPADQVYLIYVAPELSSVEPGILWDAISEAGRIQHLEDELKKRLADAKYQDVRRTVVVGDAGHAVTKHAEEVGADLIIMPSHGRRGLSRLLIGSVAERVVRLAHCPVLVLKHAG